MEPQAAPQPRLRHPRHAGDTDRLTRDALEWFDGLDQLDKMRVWLESEISNPEPAAVPMLVAVEDFTLTLDDGTVETFRRGRDRIVADHELVALAGEHRFRPVSATEDGTAGMTLSQIADEDPDLARRVLEQRAGSHGYAVAVGWRPLESGRPAVDFRRVAATTSRRRESHARRPGHRRVRTTRAGPSDDGGSEPEPPRRGGYPRFTQDGAAILCPFCGQPLHERDGAHCGGCRVTWWEGVRWAR